MFPDCLCSFSEIPRDDLLYCIFDEYVDAKIAYGPKEFPGIGVVQLRIVSWVPCIV